MLIGNGVDMTCAVFPGTFDPMTLGHMDILRRARDIFGTVIVAVAESAEKKPLLTLDERIALTRELTKDMSGVSVQGFSGLLSDFVVSQGASVVVRGLRPLGDFANEYRMAATNRLLMPGVETVFRMPSAQFQFVKSSLVREIVKMGGSVSAFVAPAATKALAAKLRTRD